MKKTKKKKHRKNTKVDPDNCCDVPSCIREVLLGWGSYGVKKKICKYHFKRHCNENDEFNLFDTFGVKHMRLGIDVDRFGIPLPPDTKEIADQIKKSNDLERNSKKEKSIARLAEWKSNGGEPKKKPKPRPEHIVKEQSDMDALIMELM